MGPSPTQELRGGGDLEVEQGALVWKKAGSGRKFFYPRVSPHRSSLIPKETAGEAPH